MDTTLFLELNRTLKRDMGAVIVRIVRQEGSAPRGVGSACMVDEDGRLTGTIGGGLVEYRAIQQAMLLIEKKVSALHPFEMNAEEITAERAERSSVLVISRTMPSSRSAITEIRIGSRPVSVLPVPFWVVSVWDISASVTGSRECNRPPRSAWRACRDRRRWSSSALR